MLVQKIMSAPRINNGSQYCITVEGLYHIRQNPNKVTEVGLHGIEQR